MSETSGKESKKSRVKNAVCYVVRSAAFCVGAFIVIPKVTPYISGMINKNMTKISNAKKSEDDWGAVIEKKHP